MLKPQVPHPHQSRLLTARNLFPCNIPKLFNIHGNIDHNQYASSSSSSSSSFPAHHSILFSINKSLPLKNLTTNAVAGGDAVEALAEECIKVKATVTVTQTLGGLLSSIGIERGLDDLNDLLGKSLLLELVSADLDPNTGLEKETIKAFVHRTSKNGKNVTYECEFEVTQEFGEVGAIFVENEHHTEMYLKEIVLDGLPKGPVVVTCDSWVHSKFGNPHKRVFFINKSYWPSQTPNGLKRLRDEELIILRGDGQGERKKGDRIYDYDIYNDIGDPDKGEAKARPVLGGKDHPYPRRCRTGRPRCEKDPSAEKRSNTFYVPRDEGFAEIKQLTFSAKTLYSGLHALVPSLETVIDSNLGFHLFSNIDSLFNEGIHLPPLQEQRKGFWGTVMPRLVKAVTGGTDLFLCFETPETMIRDRFFWFRDVEFSRQTLAGLNPYSIQLVKEWPLKSKLDPDIYGPPESAITTELIELEIKGFMTVDKAIQQKKLFIIDYHDILLPFVSRVRELDSTTLYGSRALFFLTPDGTLKPLAIELTRPPMDGKPQWKQVFTPAWHSTGCWLWRLAKVHFLSHDAGYHQLVSHWLRTHCATEPYIIATNRQLSEMHPIYRLLHPHFRYTMEINALARQALINADGIIETSFSLGKYSMEISSAAYDQQWRFDYEALPKDLIRRGLAVEDLTAPHGLSLTIEDYPFANDGLLIWDAIQTWVSDYVKHYYPNASSIASDAEIQAWWTEIRTVGHADKKDEPWWPKLETSHDLIEILTTMIWVTSGHHAAVNFGQYVYAGYFPNRPTIARANMPNEDPTNEQWKSFLNKPAMQLLKTFPSRIQATRVMAVLDILSTHSPDEEYLGEFMEKSWGEDPIINAAFERFNGRLRQIEGIIDERNANEDLKNRHGAGVMPYELLKPFSEPGVTGKGVPYSISI